VYNFFNFNSGGVQLGPLGTAATNRPIVPTPGDYGNEEIGGMMIGKGNRSTRRKPAPVPLCPSHIPGALPGHEPGPPLWEYSEQPLEQWHGLTCAYARVKFQA
jgi:hypothetical protein